ncbi:hypothetical protein LCGC14_2930350 [marine sediment metagenome]|uniref:Uncharacterized protein n=1 Tax=marine sediment metagenome TaxID=412755 RepID=A0A0F8XL27_9ZZZZ
MARGKTLEAGEVEEIKYLICRGYSQAYVAREVGVSNSMVNRICAEVSYKEIPWPCTDREAKIARERKELFPDG